jgi:hypothetical protein
VDIYVKVESMRLDWYSLPKHQKTIQAELYRDIVDTLKAGEARASEVGRLVVLPRNFNGGECDVQAQFLDAMTLVQRFGKPDYFVTITCNPYWDEIDRELFSSQTPQDRPELVARVYRSKLHNLHDRLIKKKHFGVVWAYAHVAEFQKRGLPHEHFLLVMANRDTLISPNEFDKYIYAEILDKDKYPVLHDLVCKHMMHGPCDVLNDKCACMQDMECRFRFPQQFCDATQMGKDSYPVYKRRDDRQVVEVRNAKLYNRWVIPFNPSLFMLYNCHINIEICSSIKAVKCLSIYTKVPIEHLTLLISLVMVIMLSLMRLSSSGMLYVIPL